MLSSTLEPGLINPPTELREKIMKNWLSFVLLVLNFDLFAFSKSILIKGRTERNKKERCFRGLDWNLNSLRPNYSVLSFKW